MIDKECIIVKRAYVILNNTTLTISQGVFPIKMVANYIVPNKFSIIRCLLTGIGLAILTDFLCKDAMDNQKIYKIWDGDKPIENTLYFLQQRHTKTWCRWGD